MTAKRQENYQFQGFDNPNTTPVPDVIFDELLSILREAELKALLYICRRTYGFKKDRDPISFNQFLKGITTRDGRVLDRGCGIKDRTTLSRALQALAELGIVIAEKGIDERGENTTTIYRLRFKSDDTPTTGHRLTPHSQPPGDAADAPREVVGNPYYPSRKSPPPVVGDSYPQETVLQETALQEIDPSNLRKVKPSKKDSSRDHTGTHVVNPTTTGSPVPRDPQDHKEPPHGSATGFSSIGTLLAGRNEPAEATPKRAPQKHAGDDRQQILTFIEDFATEFHDEAPLASSVSRAANLCQRSGIPVQAFTSLMYEARALTREHSSSVTKISQNHTSAWGPQKNKMAYYFAILEQLVKTHTVQPDPAPEVSTAPSDVSETTNSRRDPPPDVTPSKTPLSDASGSPVRPVSIARRPISRSVPPSPAIGAFVADLAEGMGERAALVTEVDQAMELYAQSGLSEAGFIQILSVVRLLTAGSQGGLPKFFLVLRQQLGFVDEPPFPAPSST